MTVQRSAVALEPVRDHDGGLRDVVDAVLDKGLVINADIVVAVAGVELLGIKIRAAIASFETAARYGLEFPSGTNLEAPAWRALGAGPLSCPACGATTMAVDDDALTCTACAWASPTRSIGAGGIVAEP